MEDLQPGSILTWLKHRSNDWSGPGTYNFPAVTKPDIARINITKHPFGILGVEIDIMEIDRQFDFKVPIPRSAVREVPDYPGEYGLLVTVSWGERLELYLNHERVDVIVI